MLFNSFCFLSPDLFSFQQCNINVLLTCFGLDLFSKCEKTKEIIAVECVISKNFQSWNIQKVPIICFPVAKLTQNEFHFHHWVNLGVSYWNLWLSVIFTQ